MFGYPLCPKCFNEAITQWVNEQCSLDELIKNRFSHFSKESKNDIKAMISRLTKQFYCETCGEFFLSNKYRKYCNDACKQKAYRERKKSVTKRNRK
jgi:hypothetical protein